MADTFVSAELAGKTTGQLVADYRAMSEELAKRGVLRPSRDAVGRFGKWLISRYLRALGHQVTQSRREWDLVTEDGERIEVKTVVRHDAPRSPAVALRSLDFDLLAVVVMADGLQPMAAFLIPRHRVEALAKRHETGWTLRVTPAVRADRAVVDATAQVRALADAV